MEENTKFQVDACENKSVIFPIQVHEYAGFPPQVPYGFGNPKLSNLAMTARAEKECGQC